MVKVLEEKDIDPVADALDEMLTEPNAAGRSVPPPEVGDLSDGGVVSTGGVSARVHPHSGWGGRRVEKGRPVARRAWMWNGTETLLPLSWNPSGTQHDGARKYLLKRVCLCCYSAGFTGQQCPTCVRNHCERCQSSSKPDTVVPCFYLRKEDVPRPEKLYGNVDCFLPSCPRRGDRGFMTERDMRVHARFRHRAEYQAWLESQATTRTDEVATLREQLAAMQADIARYARELAAVKRTRRQSRKAREAQESPSVSETKE